MPSCAFNLVFSSSSWCIASVPVGVCASRALAVWFSGGVGGLAYFVGEPGSDEVGDGDDPGAVVFFLSVGEVAALASADDGGFVDVAELGCSGHGE